MTLTCRRVRECKICIPCVIFNEKRQNSRDMWKRRCKPSEDTFGMPRRKSFLTEATPESKCTDGRLYAICCICSVIVCEHCVNLFSAGKEWSNGETPSVIRGSPNTITWYTEFYAGKLPARSPSRNHIILIYTNSLGFCWSRWHPNFYKT